MVKRLLTILMLLLLVMALSLAGGAIAHDNPCHGDGSDYGRNHIADHTPHGPPGSEHHNPGTTHQGYSACDPSEGRGNT